MPRRAELPNIQPARMDLTHYRGDSLSMRLTMQSQGVPVDVTLWVFEAFIRETTEGTKIAEFQPFYDLAHGADALNGVIRLVLPYQAAQELPATCMWDLQATDKDYVRTLMRGFIYTPADVTYPPDPSEVASTGLRMRARR